MEREWAMPDAHTFKIGPIKKLLMEEGAYNDDLWADPFAGFNSPATDTNDLNPETPTKSHMDALEWLQGLRTEMYDGVLYDPPYSYRQASEMYQGYGKTALVTHSGYWAKCQDEASRILKAGGKAICFGWNSGGLGMSRGCQMTRLLLVAHGGHHNDTIVTVEVKQQARLGI